MNCRHPTPINSVAGADDEVRADPADGEPGEGTCEEDVRDDYGRRRFYFFCHIFIFSTSDLICSLSLSGSYNPPPTSRRESRSEAAYVNTGADINDNVGDVERSIKARMAKRDGIMRCVLMY